MDKGIIGKGMKGSLNYNTKLHKRPNGSNRGSSEPILVLQSGDTTRNQVEDMWQLEYDEKLHSFEM